MGNVAACYGVGASAVEHANDDHDDPDLQQMIGKFKQLRKTDPEGAQSMLDEFVEARKQAVATQRGRPGELAAKEKLANALMAVGAPREAVEIQKEVVGTRCPGGPSEAPEDLRSMHSLAKMAIAFGDVGLIKAAEEILHVGLALDAAEESLREVIQVRTRVLGSTHRETLAAKHDLGRVLARQCGQSQDFTPAKKLFEEVLQGRERVLGKDHEDTLDTKKSLAATLADQGDIPCGAKMMREVAAAFERTLGAEDVKTHTARQMADRLAQL